MSWSARSRKDSEMISPSALACSLVGVLIRPFPAPPRGLQAICPIAVWHEVALQGRAKDAWGDRIEIRCC
jgi:hypothetical protein